MNGKEIAFVSLPRCKKGFSAKDQQMIAVYVMARSEGYAMIRRKGCIPFVVSEKELKSERGDR